MKNNWQSEAASLCMAVEGSVKYQLPRAPVPRASLQNVPQEGFKKKKISFWIYWGLITVGQWSAEAAPSTKVVGSTLKLLLGASE